MSKGTESSKYGGEGEFLLSNIIRMFFIFSQFHSVNNMDIHNSVKLLLSRVQFLKIKESINLHSSLSYLI